MSDKANILLVEDDMNLGFVIQDALKRKGYNVHLCRDGKEGLKKFNEHSYDLCVLDVMLPSKDGFSLAEDIRTTNALVPIVFRRGGTLEKYIGDALVAIWGAPIASSPASQALNACRAALDIQLAISALNEKFPELPLEVGIGIHHGPAYVGTIGDDTYSQYAAIGATTNLSARICGHTPANEVLVSKQIAQLLHGTPLEISPRGSFAAKGFAEDVEIYQVR